MSEQTQARRKRVAVTPAQGFRTAQRLHWQGRAQEAEQLYRAVLQLAPNHVGALHQLGILCTQSGHPQDAVSLIERSLALDPHSAKAHSDLGVALSALDRLQDAAVEFEHAIGLEPGLVHAHNNLGNALQQLNRHAEAAESFERALAISPGFAEAHNNLGNALSSLGRHAEAIAHYDHAIRLKPALAEAHYNGGLALAALGRDSQAIESYQKALAVRTDYADAKAGMGKALASLGRHAEALPYFEQALALQPDSAEAHNRVGNGLAALDRHAQAAAHYGQALAINPGSATAHHGLGKVYVTLGRLADARQAFEKAITLDPRRPEFFRSLADATKLRADDPHFLAMRNLERDSGSFPIDQQMEIHFALAKAYADVEEPERSFRHLLVGNTLKRRQVHYDEAAEFALFRRVRTVFTPELMQRMAGAGDPSTVPVFIVGMPRSGTTLVEQVLASHPRVFGAGELMDFQRAAAAICEPPGATVPYPEMLPAMSGQDLRRLGERYVEGVVTKAPAADRITDKMPGNFRVVGLIHLALSHARIIHVRRDPLDTCVSCFSKLFAGQQPFAYDLGELGRYYRAYESLMTHWRCVLPEGVMLEVQYEELIADFEPQARRIVAHCGLEWDERCLAFHETERPVRTASAMQVRQPLYRSAVGRWRDYEPWLAPLRDALAGKT